jgi:hypothetical protein
MLFAVFEHMFSFSQASDRRSRGRLADRSSLFDLPDTAQAARARKAVQLRVKRHCFREAEVAEDLNVGWLRQLRRACSDPAAGYEL